MKKPACQQWLPGEDRFIEEVQRRRPHGLTLEDIAAALQRPVASVRRRAGYLSGRRRSFQRWRRMGL